MTDDRTTLLVRLREVTNASSNAWGNPVKKLHTAEHGVLLTEPGAHVGYAVENFLPRYAAERAHGRPVTLTLAANGRVVGIERPHLGLPEPVAAPADSLALRAVLDLHRADWSCGNLAHTNPDVGCPECAEHCAECGQSWPCETVRVISAHVDVSKEADR